MTDVTVSVRVIFRGREIGRIRRALLVCREGIAVSYGAKDLLLTDGCVYLESGLLEADLTFSSAADWTDLMRAILPETLPSDSLGCKAVLRECFRNLLPAGLIEAVSCLVGCNMEKVAWRLIEDFLRESRDSDAHRQLMVDRLLAPEEMVARPLNPILDPVSHPNLEKEQLGADKPDQEWDWEADATFDAVAVDDFTLREQASKVQEDIGNYQSVEIGAGIDFSDALLCKASSDRGPQVEGTNFQDLSVKELKVLEDISRLDKQSFEILEYFSDNPADKPFHAFQVLGVSVITINKTLGGVLSKFVTRDKFGGWRCHPWTVYALEMIRGSAG